MIDPPLVGLKEEDLPESCGHSVQMEGHRLQVHFEHVTTLL